MALEACRQFPKPPLLPQTAAEITTPLMLPFWQVGLATHPDQKFTQYIVHGIEKGFHIGFNYNQAATLVLCKDALAIVKATCSESGAPIKEEKCEGPATTLPFLGMELDTVKLEIHLPSDKLERLKSLTAEWKWE